MVRVVEKVGVLEFGVEKRICVGWVVGSGLRSYICVAFHTRLHGLEGRGIARSGRTRKSSIGTSWLCLGCSVEFS